MLESVLVGVVLSPKEVEVGPSTSVSVAAKEVSELAGESVLLAAAAVETWV